MVVGMVGERSPCFSNLDVGLLGGCYGCVEGKVVLGRDGYGGA